MQWAWCLAHLYIFNLHLIDLLGCDGFLQTIIPEIIIIIIITLNSDAKKDGLGIEVGEGVVPAYPVVTFLTNGSSDEEKQYFIICLFKIISLQSYQIHKCLVVL